MVQIYWHEPKSNIALPIVAREKFLSCKSSEYGWFVSEYFLLPFYIEKKFFFRRIVFTNSMIDLVKIKNENNNEKKNFLNEVVSIASKLNVDFIYQPLTHAVFGVVPDGVTACAALTYQVDLSKSEEDLFSALHVKHRNVIKRASKNGVEILSGIEQRKDCFLIIRETMARQNKPYISNSQIEKYEKCLGENVSFYIAKKDGVVQGGAIFIWSSKGTSFYFHGGSKVRPSTGALNLLHWKAMCDMKKRGVRYFDFVGGRVSPVKGSKQEGIQRFKSRFGASAKVGFLWKIAFRPFKYKLFQLMAHFNALVRRRYYLGDIIDEELRNAK